MDGTADPDAGGPRWQLCSGAGGAQTEIGTCAELPHGGQAETERNWTGAFYSGVGSEDLRPKRTKAVKGWSNLMVNHRLDVNTIDSS